MKLIFLLIFLLGTGATVQDREASDCAQQISASSDCIVDESATLTADASVADNYNLGDLITKAINKISQFVQYGQLGQDGEENIADSTTAYSTESGAEDVADSINDSADNSAGSEEDVIGAIPQVESIEPEDSLCNITSLEAASGMLVSQVLRSSLAQCGYSMSYLAKYDCRLTSSANIQGESYQEVLASFLRSFSLAIKISTVNKMATVVAAYSSAHICTPLKYSLLIGGDKL